MGNCYWKQPLYLSLMLSVLLMGSSPEALAIFSDGGRCETGARWSEWIDRDFPGAVHVGKTVKGEHEFLTTAELEDFCSDGRVTNVECESKDGAKQNITCNVEKGLLCKDEDNTQNGCDNYRVRYLCNCQDNNARFVRDVASLPPECNDWTPWINNNHPNDSATWIDLENITRADKEQYCPLTRGAHIIRYRCTDEKGEPFYSSKNTSDYKATCEVGGYTCTPLPGKKCADIRIQFHCDCPAHLTPETTVTSSTTTTIKISTTKGNAVGETEALQEWNKEEVSIFGKTVSVCVLIVIICTLFTLCHCGLTIFVYRSLSKKLWKKKRNCMTSVYPLEKF